MKKIGMLRKLNPKCSCSLQLVNRQPCKQHPALKTNLFKLQDVEKSG